MPHGDFSDITALAMIVGGIQHMGWPGALEGLMAEHIPGASAITLTPELEMAMKFVGGAGRPLSRQRARPAAGEADC